MIIKNKTLLDIVLSLFFIAPLVNSAEAGENTKMISLNIGTQFLQKDIEVARTKAEQDENADVYGFRFESRLPAITWGISIDRYSTDWVSVVPSSRTDGTYTITTVFVEAKGSLRIYRDLFFYGGGGVGLANIDSHYSVNDTLSSISKDRTYRVPAAKGIIGTEWRFDSSVIFIDAQLIAFDSEVSSGQYDHYSGSFVPRLMMGVGFFF